MPIRKKTNKNLMSKKISSINKKSFNINMSKKQKKTKKDVNNNLFIANRIIKNYWKLKYVN